MYICAKHMYMNMKNKEIKKYGFPGWSFELLYIRDCSEHFFNLFLTSYTSISYISYINTHIKNKSISIIPSTKKIETFIVLHCNDLAS